MRSRPRAPWLALVDLVALLVVLAAPAAQAEPLQVPVDVGVGPAAYFISGPIFRDQVVHAGLKLSVEAILEKAFLQKNQNRVPAQYRRYMQGLAEVRVSPSIFIPDALIISPKLFHTGLYGVTWRPLSLGVPLGSGAAQLHLSAGLVATSFFLHSDTLPTTLFLRPGADLTAEAILMPTKTFGFSFGWQSAFYVPQALGTFFQVQPFSQDVWHLGQAFLKLHVRFPYTL